MASTPEYEEGTQNRPGDEEDKRTPEEKLRDKLTPRVFDGNPDLVESLLERDGRSRKFIDVTEQLIGLMEKETQEWTRPWLGGSGVNLMQRSAATGLPYAGLNRLRLATLAIEKGYNSPYWITPHRAEKLGHPVRKEELGEWALVFGVFASFSEYGFDRIVYVTNVVYNLEQCAGWEKAPMAWKRPPLPEPQWVIGEYVEFEMSRSNFRLKQSNVYDAYYVPPNDTIVLPVEDRFPQLDDYYMTVFHEIAHSTGPEHRLARRYGYAAFGSHDYAEEELVAQLAATFLALETGIGLDFGALENSAAYLRHWQEVAHAKAKAAQAKDEESGQSSEKEDAYKALWWKFTSADTVVSYVLNRRKLRDKIADRWRKREQGW